ncbi:MAG: DUF952 domain-containing protein [Pseudomonadota bacterium]
MKQKLIYKIATQDQWAIAENAGEFLGAPIDLTDGYIHFSTADTVRETAAKHFAGQDNLLLIAIDEKALGNDLVYEVSRGGAKFPHLYGILNLQHVVWAQPLPLGANQLHVFPKGID